MSQVRWAERRGALHCLTPCVAKASPRAAKTPYTSPSYETTLLPDSELLGSMSGTPVHKGDHRGIMRAANVGNSGRWPAHAASLAFLGLLLTCHHGSVQPAQDPLVDLLGDRWVVLA